MFILYHVNVLNSHISFTNFFGRFYLIFFLSDKIMLSANRDSFLSLFLLYKPFFFFFDLTALIEHSMLC